MGLFGFILTALVLAWLGAPLWVVVVFGLIVAVAD